MIKIDQFTAANEAAIEQFSYFAQLSLANVEKLAAIGLVAARESVAVATQHAQAVAGAKDVQEVIAINQAAIEPALKRAYTYSRSAFDTAAETGNEVKRVLEKQGAQARKSAAAAFEEALKYAPAGSETVVANMKAAMEASQGAYDKMVAANKRIYDTIEQTVEQGVATATAPKAKARKRK